LVRESDERVSLPFGLGPLAVLWIFWALLPVFTVVLFEVSTSTGSWDWLPDPLFLIPFGIFTAPCLALGVGLLLMKRWAWYLGIVASSSLLVLFVVMQVLGRQYSRDDWPDLVIDGFGALLYITTIWFLRRQRIRPLFGGRAFTKTS